MAIWTQMISSTGKSGYMVKRATPMTASGAGKPGPWQMSGSIKSDSGGALFAIHKWWFVLKCSLSWPSVGHALPPLLVRVMHFSWYHGEPMSSQGTCQDFAKSLALAFSLTLVGRVIFILSLSATAVQRPWLLNSQIKNSKFNCTTATPSSAGLSPPNSQSQDISGNLSVTAASPSWNQDAKQRYVIKCLPLAIQL